MRVTPRSFSGPTPASRYLLPYEQQVIQTRQHPAALLVLGSEASGGLLVALILNGTLADNQTLKLAVWVPAIFLIAQSLWGVGRWGTTWLVVTSHRLLVIRNLGTKRVSMTPLTELTNMSFEYSRRNHFHLPEFGMFINNSGGRPQIIFNYVPYPEQLYLEICGMMFGIDDVQEPNDTSS